MVVTMTVNVLMPHKASTDALKGTITCHHHVINAMDSEWSMKYIFFLILPQRMQVRENLTMCCTCISR